MHSLENLYYELPPFRAAGAPLARHESALGAFAPQAESFAHWQRAQYPRPT